MAIRHQPQSEKHPYASPTTPGLYVAFRDYVIELVCINVNRNIGPRFWSDQSYWAPKYRREVRGVSNIGKQLDITDTLTQTALIHIIKEYHIQALVSKKTVAKVIKLTNRRIADLKNQRVGLATKQLQPDIDQGKNSTFVDTGNNSVRAKIREVENG